MNTITINNNNDIFHFNFNYLWVYFLAAGDPLAFQQVQRVRQAITPADKKKISDGKLSL